MTPKKEMMMDSNEKTPILVLDLIRLILERLSFVDFHRARCVSRAWYSASESCLQGTNPTTPWIILFPKEDVESNNGSCKLFDPRDHASYTVKDLGSDFAKSRCLATSGSWFLMLEHRTDLYLLNLFTRQKIHLPSVESVHGCDDSTLIGSAVLWVDEKGRDYLVVLSVDRNFAYHKRGDNNESWKVLKPYKDYVDMVFKEGKLYVLSLSRDVFIYDFSGGGTPVECASLPSPGWVHYQENLKNLAVTLSGEVLIISSKDKLRGTCFFHVYKMDPKSTVWKRTKYIGDEVLLLDLGVTVAAKDGVMKNCVYFSNDQLRRQLRRYCENSLCNGDNGICVYHIKTKEVIQVFNHLTASSPMESAFKDARWFFPTLGEKWLY